VAYVLYEHYFSALLGYNILNDIITKEKKNFITVKLFTKEEDEEKQLKVHGELSKNGSSNLPNGSPSSFGQDDFLNSFNARSKGETEKFKSLYSNVFTEKNKKISTAEKTLNSVPLTMPSVWSTPYGSFYSPFYAGSKPPTHSANFNLSDQSIEKNNFECPIYSNLQKHAPSDLNQESSEKDEEVILENFFDNFSTLKIEKENKEKLNKGILPIEKKQMTEENSREQINKSKYENSIYSTPFVKSPNKNNLQNAPSKALPPQNFGSPLIPAMYPPVYFASPIPYPLQFLPESNLYYPGTQIPNSSNLSQVPSSNQFYILKFVCNYDIQIENDSKFRVTRRLIGNKGLALKKILYDCCNKKGDYTTKIRLRGKGSGYKEVITQQGIKIF
jgi:hypothetical protein